MTTRRDDMIGVYDPESGKPFCIKCWGAKDVMSLRPILLGDKASRKTCKFCKRRLSETSPKRETTGLRVILEGDGCWPDLNELRDAGKLHHVNEGLEIARLPGGMSGGRSSVSIRVPLPDGSVVMAETSMRLFLGAAQAFQAKEGA